MNGTASMRWVKEIVSAMSAGGHLGRCSSRTREHLGVFLRFVGFSLYTVDDRVLVFAGRDASEPGTVHYTHAVTADDTVVGYARVVLDRERFRPSVAELISVSAPFWLIALAATVALIMLGRRMARTSNGLTAPRGRGEARAGFVLVIILFDQNVRREGKGAVLGLAPERADQVANIYGGSAEPLQGTGILVIPVGFSLRTMSDSRSVSMRSANARSINVAPARAHSNALLLTGKKAPSFSPSSSRSISSVNVSMVPLRSCKNAPRM